jgi:hypothetical protein
MIAYSVTCEFDDVAARDDFARWLLDEHAGEVCAAGASDAEITNLDGSPPACEARYHFPSRAAFDAYLRDHAPRLREKGLARAAKGVRFRRSVGEVLR